MTNEQPMTRLLKNEKRRRNNQIILYLVIAALLFLILLIILIINNNKEDVASNDSNDNISETTEERENNEQLEEKEIPQQEEKRDDIDENDQQNNNGQYETDDLLNETFENIEVQTLQSNDDQVLEIYVADWPPIGTKHKGPHTTDYSDGSQDRIEIKRAVLLVTKIAEENLIEHWIGNGGEQKVIATVEDRSKNEFFRVYLTWIDDAGWKVTKVEKLKEYEQ